MRECAVPRRFFSGSETRHNGKGSYTYYIFINILAVFINIFACYLLLSATFRPTSSGPVHLPVPVRFLLWGILVMRDGRNSFKQILVWWVAGGLVLPRSRSRAPSSTSLFCSSLVIFSVAIRKYVAYI